MSFGVAGAILLGALALAFLQAFAAGMSDVPGAKGGGLVTLIIGVVLASAVAATHWLPHIGW